MQGVEVSKVESLANSACPQPEATVNEPWKYKVFFSEKREKSNSWFLIAALCVAALLTYKITSGKSKNSLKKVEETLRNQYLSQGYINLLISDKTIPIEKLYTRLAIIGATEKAEKKRNIEKEKPGQAPEELKDGRIPTHESIFEPKEAIQLESLFDYEVLKSSSRKRVLIQGSAGIGKSTLCRYIAYMWAKGELFDQFEYVLWIPLRDLSTAICLKDKHTLKHYLHKKYGFDEESVELFLCDEESRNKTLVLMDGYDELPAEAENQAGHLNSLLEELKNFPNVIMTTRPQPVKFDWACNLEILGFDRNGIENYIQYFFSDEQLPQADALRSQLKHPLVRSLAHIPINLEIFCSLSIHNAHLFLPGDSLTMTSIYIRMTNWLYKRFAEKNTKLKSSSIKEEPNIRNASYVEPLVEALEEIAWSAMEKNTLYLSIEEAQELAKQVQKWSNYKPDDATDLEYLKTIGPLRIDGEGEDKKAVFIHLTFQEYYAASRLARLYATKRNLAEKILKEIKFESRYKLVLYMTAGSLSYYDETKGTRLLEEFFNDLFSEPYDFAETYELNLILRCFEECRRPEKVKQYEKFIDKTIQYVFEEDELSNLSIELLYKTQKILYHPKIQNKFCEDLQNDKKQEKTLDLINRLASAGSVFPKNVLDTLVNVCNPWQYFPIYKKIAKQGGDITSGTIEKLIHILQDTSERGFIREYCAQILGKIAGGGGNISKEGIDTLVQFACDPDQGAYRKSAAKALGEASLGNRQGNFLDLETIVRLSTDPIITQEIKRGYLKALRNIIRGGRSIQLNTIDEIVAQIPTSNSLTDKKFRSLSFKIIGEIAKKEDSTGSKAIDTLISLSNHKNINVQRRALKMLKKTVKKTTHINSQSLQTLIYLANNQNLKGRSRASAAQIVAVTSAKDPLIIDKMMNILISLVCNATSKGQRKALSSLKQISHLGINIGNKAIQELTLLIQNPKTDLSVLIQATDILVEIEKRQYKPTLLHNNKLAETGISKILSLIMNPNCSKGERCSAARAMARIAEDGSNITPQTIHSLITLAKEPTLDPSIRNEVVTAIHHYYQKDSKANPDKIDDLLELAKNPSFSQHVQLSTIGAIGQLLQANPSYEESDQIITALLELVIEITKESYSLHSFYGKDRGFLIGELAKAGDKQTLEFLLENAMDPKSSIRQDAILAIGIIAQIRSSVGVMVAKTLLQLASSKENHLSTRMIAEQTLKKVNLENNVLLSEDLFNMCKIIGYPIFYSNGDIYIISKKEKISGRNLSYSSRFNTESYIKMHIRDVEEWRN